MAEVYGEHGRAKSTAWMWALLAILAVVAIAVIFGLKYYHYF